MKRPSYQAPAAKPVVKTRVGPNWKLLVHFCIIAGLIYAISIAWQNLGEAKTLAWHLDVWLRSLPKTEQTDWLPHVTRIKSAASHGRVPASIPESSGILLSGKMTELTNAAVAKQSEINRGFLSETGKIHRAYLARIRDAISQAESSGQAATAVALGRASESAAKLESWLQSLGADFQSADDSPLTQ